ncbi:PTS system trehalose(maltose)-specific transporter subunit IIBC [Salmonella enterica subsp. enterica]|uniref:PTS system trehalose(Maltose)-specific transporter subunit IIBC n=1 Tax=Salmonella enterica I TaxID=59201 RepID=A0A379VXN1_SALET|nr:PTS system trehalose(maltose)-specific transporter subunit IIBC [Salmonella enterica subsp. enterica]
MTWLAGRDNIATVSHCITRLRFVLHQPANARPKEIEQLPMVKGCFTNAGQFQVVIGTEVGDYYNALLETTGKAYADKEQAKKAARQNMKWHEQLISPFRGDLLSATTGVDQWRFDLRLS